LERWGLQRKYKAGAAHGPQHPTYRSAQRERETRPEAAYTNPGYTDAVQAGIKSSAKIGLLGRVIDKLFGRRA
jgi:hypothetical protein